MFHCCIEKIEPYLETLSTKISSNAQRINLTFVPHRFIANFVNYISAKYYLNRFSFHIVIMKVVGVNFFWNTVYTPRPRKKRHLFYICDNLIKMSSNFANAWQEHIPGNRKERLSLSVTWCVTQHITFFLRHSVYILHIMSKVSEHIASNKRWKLRTSTTPLSFDASFPSNPRE